MCFKIVFNPSHTCMTALTLFATVTGMFLGMGTSIRIFSFSSCIPETDIFLTLYGMTFGQCVRKCNHSKHCTIVGFHRLYKRCTLANTDVGSKDELHTYLHRCLVNVVVMKDDIQNNWTDAGVGNASSPNVCSTGSFSNCVIKGNMHYEGHKIRVSCKHAGQLYEYGSFVCDSTGMWLKGRINNGCPEGFIRVPSLNTSCYRFGTNELSFDQAQAYCQRYNSHLVFMETQQEIDSLRTYILTSGIVDRYTIGLTDLSKQNKNWVWRSGNGTYKSADFYDWFPEEPNNYQKKLENCVGLAKSKKYRWSDVSCNTTMSPVCEIEI